MQFRENSIELCLCPLHAGTESVGFKAVSMKEDRICFIDEKEVNLRDLALEPSYPADSGEVSVKANW